MPKPNKDPVDDDTIAALLGTAGDPQEFIQRCFIVSLATLLAVQEGDSPAHSKVAAASKLVDICLRLKLGDDLVVNEVADVDTARPRFTRG